MLKKCEIPVESLYKKINFGTFKFKTTAEVDDLDSVIGQERAVSAINFALEIEDAGYNILKRGNKWSGKMIHQVKVATLLCD